MLKMVLDDYRRNFNSGMKHYFSSYMVGIHACLWVVMPTYMKEGKVIYFFIIIPLILAQILMMIYADIQNKTLFLCPLSKEQREQHFKTSLCLRIGVPMGVLGVLVGGLGCLHQITGVESLVLIVMIFLYIASCFLPNGRRIPSKTQKINARNYDTWNLIVHVSGFMNLFCIISEIVNKEPIILFDGVCIAMMTALQFVAFLVMWCRYYKLVKQIFTEYDALNGNFRINKEGEA